jgi:uncharacterized repeat protein (TIGR02543 family)
MTKVEALHEVITALGGTPEGTTVSECIAEITTIEGGAPTAGASTSDAIHELAVALGYEPGPTPPVPTEKYTVSFDPNGATSYTVLIDPIEVTAGESTALPDASAYWSREGYTFAGWAESAESTTAVADPYTPAGDIKLYAIWQEQAVVTLTFGIGSGAATGDPFTKEFPVGVPTALPTWAECQEQGWSGFNVKVDGWYTSSGSESDPAADPYTATTAETLTAIWVPDL